MSYVDVARIVQTLCDELRKLLRYSGGDSALAWKSICLENSYSGLISCSINCSKNRQKLAYAGWVITEAIPISATCAVILFSSGSLTWWRHQVETFSALLALCAGISPMTDEFPAQRPVTGSFDVSLICAWIYCWGNNREAGDLRRHRVHYDVTVMREKRSLSHWLRPCSVVDRNGSNYSSADRTNTILSSLHCDS